VVPKARERLFEEICMGYVAVTGA